MEGYSLTANFIKQAKQYSMSSPEYKIYADLRAAGNSMQDSWAIAFQGKGLNWPKSELLKEMNRLEALDSVQRRIAEVRGERDAKAKSDDISAEELAKETSKEVILKKLVTAEKKAKYGSPDWLKIISLEADYNKIKQDEIDKENNIVHYYIPARYPTSHKDCLLFLNGQCAAAKGFKEKEE